MDNFYTWCCWETAKVCPSVAGQLLALLWCPLGGCGEGTAPGLHNNNNNKMPGIVSDVSTIYFLQILSGAQAVKKLHPHFFFAGLVPDAAEL